MIISAAQYLNFKRSRGPQYLFIWPTAWPILRPLCADLYICTLKCSKCVSDHLETIGFGRPVPASLLWPYMIHYICMPKIFVAVAYFYTKNSPKNHPHPRAKGPASVSMHRGPHSPKCSTDCRVARPRRTHTFSVTFSWQIPFSLTCLV